MKVVESSLIYRGVRHGGAWIAEVARYSLLGRFLLALARDCALVCADSTTLGLQHSGSRTLQREGHPWCVLVISRPYSWLRRSLGGTNADAPARRPSWLAAECFQGGAWVTVVGAGLFALGCGRLALLVARGPAVGDPGAPYALSDLGILAAAVLIVAGALLFAAGRRLVPALRTSLLARATCRLGVALVEGRSLGPRGTAPGAGVDARAGPRGGEGRPVEPLFWRRLAGPLGLGVILAVAAGFVGGLTPGSGPLILVGLLAAVCVLALVLWRPEAMLLALAAFPWLDWAARRSLGGVGPAWDEAFLILAMVVLLWCVLVLRRSELWTVPIMLPVLAAFAAAIGSVVVREVPGDVALFALRVLFQPLLFYFLGFWFPKSKRWVQWTVAVFMLTGVAMALHGLYQYLTHAPMPAHWIDVREIGEIQTRAYSIVENPNGLGAFLLIGVLLSLSLALTPRLRGTQRWAMAAACVVQLAGVAVTFSRGAWLGLGAGILALIIMAYRRYLARLVVAGVLAWLVLPQKFIDRLAFGFSSAYITKSIAGGRLYVWKISLQHVADHPLFGLGLGTFGGTSAATFAYGRLWVDNFYLQLAAEGGLLLLALFIWVLLRMFKGLVKSYKASSDPYVRALNAGVFAGCVAVTVANVTASVWEALVVGAGFWFLAGLATSAGLHEAGWATVGTES